MSDLELTAIKLLADDLRRQLAEVDRTRETLREMACDLALNDGYSAREIGRMIGISNVAVSKWLRE